MAAKQASRICEICGKLFYLATDAGPTYMEVTCSELLCLKCKRGYMAQITNSALRDNVEKMWVLMGRSKH